MDARKRITQVVGLAAITQLLAMVMLGGVWSVLGPPLAAALPVALLTMRSPETVQAIAPRLRQAYVGVAIVGSAVVASFAWSGDDLGFDLRFVRAVFTAFAILWLASTLGVQAATMRQPS